MLAVTGPAVSWSTPAPAATFRSSGASPLGVLAMAMMTRSLAIPCPLARTLPLAVTLMLALAAVPVRLAMAVAIAMALALRWRRRCLRGCRFNSVGGCCGRCNIGCWTWWAAVWSFLARTAPVALAFAAPFNPSAMLASALALSMLASVLSGAPVVLAPVTPRPPNLLHFDNGGLRGGGHSSGILAGRRGVGGRGGAVFRPGRVRYCHCLTHGGIGGFGHHGFRLGRFGRRTGRFGREWRCGFHRSCERVYLPGRRRLASGCLVSGWLGCRLLGGGVGRLGFRRNDPLRPSLDPEAQ